MKIGIIDYGTNQVGSLRVTLKQLGIKTILTTDLVILKEVDGIILPNGKSAKASMKEIKNKKLDAFLCSTKQPVLGISLGMQLMCTSSEEQNTLCLNIFKQVQVKKFHRDNETYHNCWNTVNNGVNFMKEITTECYFNHNYYVENNQFSIGETTFGERFSSVMVKDNFIGCQFHPDAGNQAGEQVLNYFTEACKRFAILKYLNIY